MWLQTLWDILGPIGAVILGFAFAGILIELIMGATMRILFAHA